MKKEIEEILNQLEADAVPFHDIFRALYGFNESKPTKEQLERTLLVVEELIEQHSVVGRMSIKGEIVKYSEIMEKTLSEEYDSFNYSIWFDKRYGTEKRTHNKAS